MKNRHIAAAALTLIAISGGAFAQEATSDTWMQIASTKTRADVQVELTQARADGSIRFSRAGYIEPMTLSRSREAVKADVLAARRSGELAIYNAEQVASAPDHEPALVIASSQR